MPIKSTNMVHMKVHVSIRDRDHFVQNRVLAIVRAISIATLRLQKRKTPEVPASARTIRRFCGYLPRPCLRAALGIDTSMMVLLTYTRWV